MAVAIGREAINADYAVLFISAPTPVAQLAKTQPEGRLDEHPMPFSKPKL